MIAVGDVHGCAEELDELLESIAPTPDDLLIFLGDYVDRGPDSRGVIEQLIALESRCRLVTLMGNHDAALLAIVDGSLSLEYWDAIGGDATLASYGELDDPRAIEPAHVAWIRRCPRWFELPEHFFVHANYLPTVPLNEQPDDVRLWTSLRDCVPSRHVSGKIAVVGHTPQAGNRVLDQGHLLCLDTGCCYGGSLTAREIYTGGQWQAKSRQPRDPRW